MKSASLIAAITIVIAADAVALIHAARNRTGAPDAEITLTERELTILHSQDNSAVALLLLAEDPNRFQLSDGNPAAWLDRAKLASLGFDCSVDPSDERASDFYGRQVPRAAFVALEYGREIPPRWSRLVAVNAALDPAQLRVRYPDGKAVAILPAVIRVSASNADPRRGLPARVTGGLEGLARSIHVPSPFSEKLRALPPAAHPALHARVRFGSLLDPYLEGLELEASTPGRPAQ